MKESDAESGSSPVGSAESEGAVTFSEAMQSLEAILRRIEGEEIDIDDLASELRRASVLLETARAKIARAELEVTQIVSRLEPDSARGGDG